MTTISVDLAYRRYRDIGVAVMKGDGRSVFAEFISIPLAGDPEPDRLADYLVDLCASHRVSSPSW